MTTALHKASAHDVSPAIAQGDETQPLAELVAFPAGSASLTEVLAPLTYALDLAAGERAGFALRCCVIGMNLGQRLQLGPERATELFYALLLNGLGTTRERTATYEWLGMDEMHCRHALRGFDWTKIESARVRYLMQYAFQDKSPVRGILGIAGLLPRRRLAPVLYTRRSFSGARLARKLGLPVGTVEVMQNMDERWDGTGSPRGLVMDAIPLASHICCAAQDLAAFGELIGRAHAVALLEKHSGSWYDPGVVAAAITMHEAGTLWKGVDEEELVGYALGLNPESDTKLCDDDALETICSAVAEVIDNRSKYTAQHSHGVAQLATRIGEEMGVSEREMKTLRCAALLHDIGKLGIASDVLDKEGPLTDAQWNSVQRAPMESYEILRRIRNFEPIAQLTRTQHERLDGSGYPQGIHEKHISKLSRILAVAEAFHALSSTRPYREDLSQEEVLEKLQDDVPHALDATTMEALKRVLQTSRP